jgi:hypothetical protein
MNNLKQNNRRGKVIAQHYCMVKIPCAETGYTILSSGEGQEQVQEEADRRLEQISKNKYNKW